MTDTCAPSFWLTFWAAFGAVLAGLATAGAVFVAWQQYRTQDLARREQLRLALLDKRYQVMQATGELLAKLGRDASLDHMDVLRLRGKTAMAACLFDEKIVWLLEAITDSAFNFVVAHRAIERFPPNSPEREAACDREEELLGWLTGELRTLRDHFAPYFTFKER